MILKNSVLAQKLVLISLSLKRWKRLIFIHLASRSFRELPHNRNLKKVRGISLSDIGNYVKREKKDYKKAKKYYNNVWKVKTYISDSVEIGLVWIQCY